MSVAKIRFSRFAAVILVLSFAGIVGILWENRNLPPLGTDALCYHLTMPAVWLQDGLFGRLDLPFDAAMAEHYPKLMELVNFLLMAFTGDDGLIMWAQLLVLFAMTYLYYLSSRLMGAGRQVSALLAAMLLFFPPFGEALMSGKNDLLFTCCSSIFLCGILLSPINLRRGLYFSFTGLAGMLATKSLGLIYLFAGLVVISPSMIFWFDRTWLQGKSPWTWDVLMWMLLLVCGTSSYIENFILFSNPVYPAHYTWDSWVLFPGLYRTADLHGRSWDLGAWALMLLHKQETFAISIGHGLLFWTSYIAYGFSHLGRKLRRRSYYRLTAAWGFPLIAIVLCFLLNPVADQPRYLMPVYYSLWLAPAGCVGWLRKSGGQKLFHAVRLLPVAAIVGQWILSGLGQRAWFWVGVIIVCAAAMAPWNRLGHGVYRFKRPAIWVLLIVLSTIVVWRYPSYRQERERWRYRYYTKYYGVEGQAWHFIETRNHERGPLHIAYGGSPYIYPLFGARLQNRVRYIPISDSDHYQSILDSGDGSVIQRLSHARRKVMDEDVWLAGLKKNSIDFIYLVNDPAKGGVEPELAIINKYPRKFELVFEAGRVLVFRVFHDPDVP